MTTRNEIKRSYRVEYVWNGRLFMDDCKSIEEARNRARSLRSRNNSGMLEGMKNLEVVTVVDYEDGEYSINKEQF